MAAEVFQAQVIKNFFDTITGPDRNLTRIFMCVMSLTRLRQDSPEKVAHLVEQLRRSKQQRELSIDILDYVCDAAVSLDITSVKTAFGVREIGELAGDFSGISLDTL